MMKKLLFLFLLIPSYLFSQQLGPLTVEKIMRDPVWIGTSPSNPFWSPDGQTLYFNWNPDQSDEESLYAVTLKNHTPQKIAKKEAAKIRAIRRATWNPDHQELLYVQNNTLYLYQVKSKKEEVLVRSASGISSPSFLPSGKIITFRMGQDLYKLSLKNGGLTQLTHFTRGNNNGFSSRNSNKKLSPQEAFLEKDALENSVILRERKEKKDKRRKQWEPESNGPKTIDIGKKRVSQLSLSPNGKRVFYQLMDNPKIKRTIVPNYVTQSGYTEDIPGRPVVGVEQATFKNYIYDIEKDTVITINTAQIPGIRDIPKFYNDYPEELKKMKAENALREVNISAPLWNPSGTKAFVVALAEDHKDRWVLLLNPEDGSLKLLDRQHDDAWIGGPGMGYFGAGTAGWVNDQTIYYQSEKTGYSHLYTQNIKTNKKRDLTLGKYEVQAAKLSQDRKTFYLTTNAVSPAENHFYKLNIKSGKQEKITTHPGWNEGIASPDGTNVAVIYSTSNHPQELYLQQNKANASRVKITDKAESPEFKSYSWRKPKIFTFKDRDNLEVYAEVYKPEKQADSRPGVIFVHGAGYLQDVKNGWSDPYFREHMFMNLLADQGYTVMNIDYRGSAGYGRDWRTAIYRHMGKNDLADVVDGAKYMVDHFNVDADKIGVWGGSYGGFMTLMAMLKTNTFAAGGALRSVTDWAHYNHGYTSDILNLPQNDPKAYKQSSPIYFAKGLQGHLLMAHGMVDTNVHFQDIVRLTQRFIELGKDHWELAVYPVESHGFVEPSSWTDEYKRIYKLFEENLK